MSKWRIPIVELAYRGAEPAVSELYRGVEAPFPAQITSPSNEWLCLCRGGANLAYQWRLPTLTRPRKQTQFAKIDTLSFFSFARRFTYQSPFVWERKVPLHKDRLLLSI